VSESPVLVVAGVVALLIAFTGAVGARDEARAEAKRVRAERARRRQTRAKPGGMQPPPAEDPALMLHLRDYTEPR
jgi:type II secretory pathway pseudopilin PulG